MVIMLEPHLGFVPPKPKQPVVMLERHLKKPVVTLEPRQRPMVMLERCPQSTSSQPKKPLVTLERRKVVTIEPQKIVEKEQQPPCIAPATIERESPLSTSSNNTMEEIFQ